MHAPDSADHFNVWFVETGLTLDLSAGDIDILADLSGQEDSMFDIVSFVWTSKDADILNDFCESLTAMATAAVPTPTGTLAVWDKSVGHTMQQRLAAIILHQLTYNDKVTVCWEWDPDQGAPAGKLDLRAPAW